MKRSLNWVGVLAVVAIAPSVVSAAGPSKTEAPASQRLDAIIADENAKAQSKHAALEKVDDLTFLRRIYVDLIGRIPNAAEIKEFATDKSGGRRERLIDKLLADERFADRWTLFYADMLRIRSQSPGGAAMMAFVHNAIKTGMPYDEMCRRLIASNGRAGKTPEVGFVLGDDADPLAMASVTSQVFLGVRIGCAQCHDHPFDVWKRRDFYDLAAFYGKTRRFESQLTRVIYATETDQTSVLWPPEGVGPSEERKPIDAKFPFELVSWTKSPEWINRLEKRRAEKKAALAKATSDSGPSVDDLLESSSEKVDKTTSGKLAAENALSEAKQDIRKIDVTKSAFRASELREQLAEQVTAPGNKYFAQALVNRVWKTLVGRGFVEPVDDFRADNPAAHPEAMDYLAQEFVASDFELRSLVRTIVASDAYQRAHAPFDMDPKQRSEMEERLLATPVRRMIAESLYDSVVTAGRLFEPKHSPGRNEKTLVEIVRVPKEGASVADLAAGGDNAAPGGAMMAGMPASAMSSAGYALEGALELDFTALLASQGEDGGESVEIDEMKAMSTEEIEAQRMMQRRMMRAGMKEYEEKRVERTIDDNPVFNTALRMQSPAPEGHFLRIFGQPGRTELGDMRDDSASMRQALMMLNGRITHEAARVGDLEPIYSLLTGRAPDFDKAVDTAYIDILTRKPTKTERAEGRALIEAGDSPEEGMADLRWVLLNCNEFRFLP